MAGNMPALQFFGGGDEAVGTVAAAFLATPAAPQEVLAAQGAIRVEVGRGGDRSGGVWRKSLWAGGEHSRYKERIDERAERV